MTLFNAITSQNAAYDAILRCTVEPLPAEYTTEDVNKYRKSLESTARSVPSRHDGGSVGYVGVITSTPRYQEILGNVTAASRRKPTPETRRSTMIMIRLPKLRKLKQLSARKAMHFIP